MRIDRVAVLVAASVLLLPVATAGLDYCEAMKPLPCLPTPNTWLNNTCGDAAFVQGYVLTSVRILLIATGVGCGIDVALP